MSFREDVVPSRFFCRKKGIFNAAVGKMLSKVVLTVALPALAFNSFMQDINPTMLKQGRNVLIGGVLIYIILIFISKPAVPYTSCLSLL
ncbi:AEC family transporter [Paenibacillus polymyxa]|uniref:AEC family transporter n=1 Tax=Paenibacillus polymyxa TaxID=1406 RepID=UPI0037C6FFA3